jgi:hypothetical protein
MLHPRSLPSGRSVRAAALLVSVLLAVTAVAGGEPISGRVMVAFEPGMKIQVDKSSGAPRTGLTDLDAILVKSGATAFEPLFGDMPQAFDDPEVRADLERHYLLRHPGKNGNEAVIAELGAIKGVVVAESDMMHRAHGTAFTPNDLSANQWYLRNTSIGGPDIHAVGGWAETLGDSTIIVADCDTGVDWRHPDLGGPHPDKVNGAIWTNWTEYYGTAGVDDDGNGLIDDIRGWDFVNELISGVWPGEDPGPPDNDPMDFNGHGTLVAGCIAPLADNGIGIAATAPGCKVMAIRIGWQTSDGQGVSTATYMAQGFVYAAANGARVVNLSYGTSASSAFNSAINSVLTSGGVVFNSAGNDDDDIPYFLGLFTDPRVVSVAATDSGDGKSSFSNYGDWVDISAPGSVIYTTAYDHQTGSSTYATTQGTSFASPIAAAACALIWSSDPSMSANDVIGLLMAGCDNIDDINPSYIGKLGAGRVNLLRSLGDNVHQVPQEFARVYDALNSAAPGDTVKVASTMVLTGTMTVPDTGIHVLGAYDASYTTRDVDGGKTAINATTAAPGISFFGTADNGTVVDGFVVSGGGGSFTSGIPYSARYGGGILLNGDSPTLRNIEITNCSVGSSSQLGCGGGIAAHNSQAVLENVLIHGNTAILGAGLFANDSQLTLTGCEIRDNVSRQDNLTNAPQGGGLHVLDSDIEMTGCTISGHGGVKNGGGVYAAGLDLASNVTMNGGVLLLNEAELAGGGVYVNGGSATLTGVVFDQNGASAGATFMHGGGLYATAATVAADSLAFTTNDANVGGGAELNGCPSADVTNSVFANNAAVFWGGALAYDTIPSGSVTGNTMTGNSGGAGGGGLYLANATPAVTHNISAFNTGAATYGNGMALQSAPSSLMCNDVFGNENANYSGQPDPTGTDGNISEDPLFCDPDGADYGLSAGSPCAVANSGGCGLIGALGDGCGAVSSLLLSFDAEWRDGRPLLTWRIPAVVDGAPRFRLTGQAGRTAEYEVPFDHADGVFTAADGQAPAGAVVIYRLYLSYDGQDWSLLNETELKSLPAVAGLRALQVWPNPFNPQTTVRFEVGAPEQVRVAVYDVSGRLVRVIADRLYPAGAASETWRGDDQRGAQVASGPYFVLVEAESGRLTTKVLLLQ